MQRRIIVSADDYEVRIAVIENSKLAEYFLERRDEKRTVGNIYKGKVTSIIPGIEAAFVDIGLSRNAFLYVNDLLPQMVDLDYFEDTTHHSDKKVTSTTQPQSTNHSTSIQDLVQEEQHLQVQLYKEPIGTKGSRVTSNLSIAGRYLVLLPCTDHLGISRRIEDEDERERLKKFVSKLLPPQMGAIVRTAGKEATEEEFRSDMEFLLQEWSMIQEKYERSPAPSLIFQNPGMVYLLIRDLISDGIEEIVVDDPTLYTGIVNFVKEQFPKAVDHVSYYDESAPVFRAYGVESEIAGLRTKKVWLHSGGYIVIDETEAMTVIDVNTGRYLGKHNLEETVFKTNIESATEIARQLRLRDIGGIIIVDFIDMISLEHKQQLIDHLETRLKMDRSRTNLYPLTDLGLLQMTRKRVRKSLNKAITQPCPYCKRDGHILSVDSMIIKIFRIFEEICKEEEASSVTLRIHPRLVAKINEEKKDQIRTLEARYNAELKILPGADIHFEQIVEEIV